MSGKKICVYSDGGARGNPGPAAIGVLICDAHGKALQEFRKVIGHATNNVAEYTAIIEGLDLAQRFGAEEIDWYTDSQLVERQLKGEYRIKTPHIKELYLQVKEKEKYFRSVKFTHVPRTNEGIRHVDRLVNRALDEA